MSIGLFEAAAVVNDDGLELVEHRSPRSAPRAPSSKPLIWHVDQSRNWGVSVGEVERWHLPSIEASGTREPRVLFSQPEFRGVVIDLNLGDELGDHRLYEHSVLQVVSGRLGVSGNDDAEMECEAGTLLTFAPKETRSLRALEPSRILLVLAPWPGDGHFPDDREPEPEQTRQRRKSAEPPHG